MVPPLRHRGADVELLAEHFRAGFAQEFRKDIVGFTRDALEPCSGTTGPATCGSSRA